MTARPTIIIGGSGRCGTTLLHQFMMDHPQVWAGTRRHESHIFAPPDPTLVDLARRASGNDQMDKEFLLAIKNHVKTRFMTPFGAAYRVNMGEERLLSRIDTFFEKVSGGLFNDMSEIEVYRKIGNLVWSLVWGAAPKGAKYWCEKSPWNVLVFDDIDKMLPGSKFVHIIRDPRDVIDSVSTKKWGPKTVEQCVWWYGRWARQFECALERGVRDMPNYLELRYESFVRDPKLWTRLWTFLGLKEPPRPGLQPQNEGRHKRWSKRQFEVFDKLRKALPRVDEWTAETKRITG